jgi:hypothetical protein
VLYRDSDGSFKPVKNAAPYGVEKDTFNKVMFEPIQTDALRVEISLQQGWSAGVQEVIIE